MEFFFGTKHIGPHLAGASPSPQLRSRRFPAHLQGEDRLSFPKRYQSHFGGNGLGKTTLVQALIYGLTGGVSEAFEEEKSLRWGHLFFKSRLDNKQLRSARVIVSFSLGKEKLHVRRSFSNGQIDGFKSNSMFPSWLQDSERAQNAMNAALRDAGGYHSFDDFAFVVHRLLYLPENRRLLAWDTNAQTRLLMLLNRDLTHEDVFRRKRERLKLLDSRKRHVHVQFGHTEQALSNLLEEASETDTADEKPDSSSSAESRRDELELPTLVESLDTAARDRIVASNKLQSIARGVSSLADEVDELQVRTDDAEATLIASLLDGVEKETNLAIYKLLETAICPCCGTKQKELQSAARQHQKDGKCILCGSQDGVSADAELASLRSQLSEKTAALQANEEAYRVQQQRYLAARSVEDEVQTRVNTIRFRQPVVLMSKRSKPINTREQLEQQKRELAQEEAELALQVRELQAELEREYKVFLDAVSHRMTTLRRAYEVYASAFLGLRCELVPETDPDRLLNLTAFIPQFNGSLRATPDTCSEAQRFFLDIAFRMALLDLAADMSSQPNSFVCETPENALDLSYLDNVARMFQAFAKKKHAILLTTNIQEGGLATRIMSETSPSERRARVLNLLDVGQLSEVQQRSLSQLKKIVRQVTS